MSNSTRPNKLVKPAPRPIPVKSPPSPVPDITIEPSEADSIDELSNFFDGLSQWKGLVSELGPRFDSYGARLDRIEETFLSVLDKAHKTATICANIGSTMKLVNRFIEFSSPTISKSQIREDISDALRRCEKMMRDCEDCKTMFSELNNELLSVQQDIQDDIILCQREVKKHEQSKKWLKVANRIAQAITLVAAAAASLMGAFFSFGVPLVAIPLAFSVVMPIISFNLNSRIKGMANQTTDQLDALTHFLHPDNDKKAGKPKKELTAFFELEDGIDIGSERAYKMMHWWEDIRREVETLSNEIKNGAIKWGSGRSRAINTSQWQDLTERLDDHGDRLQKQIAVLQARRSRSPSLNFASSANSSSSRLSENGYGSPPLSERSLRRSSSRSSTSSDRSERSIESTRSQPGAIAIQKSMRDRGSPKAQTMSISWG